jgi:hypothetical protein
MQIDFVTCIYKVALQACRKCCEFLVEKCIEWAGQTTILLGMHFTGERKVLPWVLSYLEADPALFAKADTLGYLLWFS